MLESPTIMRPFFKQVCLYVFLPPPILPPPSKKGSIWLVSGHHRDLVCLHTQSCTCTLRVCTPLHTCVCACACVRAHTHTHTHTQTHRHTHTHTHTHTFTIMLMQLRGSLINRYLLYVLFHLSHGALYVVG